MSRRLVGCSCPAAQLDKRNFLLWWQQNEGPQGASSHRDTVPAQWPFRTLWWRQRCLQSWGAGCPGWSGSRSTWVSASEQFCFMVAHERLKARLVYRVTSQICDYFVNFFHHVAHMLSWICQIHSPTSRIRQAANYQLKVNKILSQTWQVSL